MTPADVPGILVLIGEIFEEYGCKLNAEHEDTYLLNPGGYFRGHGGEFWVVEETRDARSTTAGRIVATIAVTLHADAGELKCLYVHPAHRRRGWGRWLSGHAMDYVRRAGKPRVILWSDTRFAGAHELYRGMGFHQDGVRELHDSNDTVEYGFYMDFAPA